MMDPLLPNMEEQRRLFYAARKAERARERTKEENYEAARERQRRYLSRYNSVLARAKPGSVELLLYSRRRGMSEARLIEIWGIDFVLAATQVEAQVIPDE